MGDEERPWNGPVGINVSVTKGYSKGNESHGIQCLERPNKTLFIYRAPNGGRIFLAPSRIPRIYLQITIKIFDAIHPYCLHVLLQSLLRKIDHLQQLHSNW